MAAKFSGKKHFNADANQIVSIVKDTSFAQSLNLEMKSETPDGDGFCFRFHHGVSFSSWGEKITVTVTPDELDTVTVTVKSECAVPVQILDFGKNVQNVRGIFGHVEKRVPTSAPSNPTLETKICNSCGKRIPDSDRFCLSCGARQDK